MSDGPSSAREARLAQALRDNLRRRKTQARAMETPGAGAAGAGEPLDSSDDPPPASGTG